MADCARCGRAPFDQTVCHWGDCPVRGDLNLGNPPAPFLPPAKLRVAAGEADFCSREGANALKAKIEAYWRERGQNVQVMLHNVGFHPAIRAARFDVRSDMINGMPRSAGSSAKRQAPAETFIEDFDNSDDDLVFE